MDKVYIIFFSWASLLKSRLNVRGCTEMLPNNSWLIVDNFWWRLFISQCLDKMYTASLVCSVRFPTSYMLCEFHRVITLKNVCWKSFIRLCTILLQKIIFINSRQVNFKQLIYIINIVSFTYFLIYRLSKRLIAASLQSYLSIDVQYEVRNSKLNTIMRKLFTFHRETNSESQLNELDMR